MTNPPITSNNSQSPAMGAPATATLLRTDTAVPGNAAPAAQENSLANDQVAQSFAVLLAQQVAEIYSPIPNSAPIFSSITGKAVVPDAGPSAKDAQDRTMIATRSSSDPANALAAMLLQIPVQPIDAPSGNLSAHDSTPPLADPTAYRGRINSAPLIQGASGIRQVTDDGVILTSGGSGGTDRGLPKTDGRQQTNPSSLIPQPSDSSMGTPSTFPKTDNSQHDTPSPIPVPSAEVKQVEMVAASYYVGPSQSSPYIAKTDTLVDTPAVMPNMMPSNSSTDIQQIITTPVGKSGWADEFSQKIIWMSTQQKQTAELRLNPPDLGPINVVLKISDNQVTAQFTSPHSAVRDAVENALPKLREILADNNIMLGNATVSDQPPRDRSGNEFMNQNPRATTRSETPHIAIESNALLPASAQDLPARRHNGLLDTFA
jgi:flagellar hook-length control protein FliK